jgi:hypothetical protein
MKLCVGIDKLIQFVGVLFFKKKEKEKSAMTKNQSNNLP